jgi:S1-C subfamily serine protease
VDLLDAVIILLTVGAIGSGWRRGLTWVGFSMAGLLIGVAIGAAVAQPIGRRFGGHNASSEALIATGVFLALVAIVQGIGTAIGYRIRIAALRTELAKIDSGLGAFMAAVGVLAVAWFLGLTFASSQFTRLSQQIRNSAVLRALDNIAPRPPGFLISFSNILRDPNLGTPFSGIGEPDLSPVQIPADVNTKGVQNAANSVAKVLSSGCGLEAGSSWPLGSDYFVTNAHVVAGGQDIHVELPQSGRRLPATVVLFDPNIDVAVLRAPGAGLAGLPIAGDPQRGVQGAVIGYPGGGSETVVGAAVRGVEDAQGRDIYNSGLVTRRIEVLQAQVIPGDSGGPLVDLNGRVIGLVFAASTVQPDEGYALAMSQISGDLNAARGRTQGVSTQDCTN